MNGLVSNKNDEMLWKILSSMFQILDEKNITQGITIVIENGKLYICFDKNCLSETNVLILEKISYVYSETLFHSDNKQSPNSDRLEYWCPDEDYDMGTHITERCQNKKMVVLELSLNDQFIIFGTSIMLASTLQEQDPMHLKINEELVVVEEDLIKRQKHYISSGRPDLGWINLRILLNRENSLWENAYAHRMYMCEINSPVLCDNIISTVLMGYNEKVFINFCMEKEDLEKAIKEHFKRQTNGDEAKNIELNEIQKRLLKS